jgi:hypothetical protein
MGAIRVGCAAAAFAAIFVGSATPASAQKVSAKGDTAPPVRALAGVSVQYEEKAASRILYLEEKGGMVSPLPPPVPANVPEPTPAIAVQPKSQSAVAPPKKAAARKAAT